MARRPVIDPDNVPELLCDGQFYIHGSGPLVTLTFTHARPNATAMFAEEKIDPHAIVRARIVVSRDNLIALRDLLNRILQDPKRPTAGVGGASIH